LKSIPELKTKNLIISLLHPEDFKLLVNYESENRIHLSHWEPTRSAEYFSVEETQKRVERNIENFRLGSSISFVGFNQEQSKIICLCTFSNIVHGAFQACHLGYSISEKEQGKGLMFEMLQASIEYVFTELGLHRVMANHMPSNIRSERLLARLGFEREGIAKSYLKIAGLWQDHVLTSKINQSHTDSVRPQT
jgi:ribosomal-protein-alanine N-acetyltransferase